MAIEHTYWQKRYGHGPRVLTREQIVMTLVRQEGLPQWAAENLVSLAASCVTLTMTFEENATHARRAINSEFYVTARTVEDTSPQREMLLGNLESREYGR